METSRFWRHLKEVDDRTLLVLVTRRLASLSGPNFVAEGVKSHPGGFGGSRARRRT